MIKGIPMICILTYKSLQGGIAPNQVIARSEFEVHRQMFTEWM